MENIGQEPDKGSDKFKEASPEELLEFARHYRESYIICGMIQMALAERLTAMPDSEAEAYRPLWHEVADLTQAAKVANTGISD